jgi:two-component system, sensor histidine kinase and response regulator
LLEDLLRWVRVQSGKITLEPQKLSFTDIRKDILKNFNPVAQAKNITINNNVSDEINVFADSDMLKVILRNLVSNAIKFTNKNGTININATQMDSNVTISVSDNGIGIAADDLTKLFDISQVVTTKRTAKETGTGK